MAKPYFENCEWRFPIHICLTKPVVKRIVKGYQKNDRYCPGLQYHRLLQYQRRQHFVSCQLHLIKYLLQ